mgnify:CR=1 FL=1
MTHASLTIYTHRRRGYMHGDLSAVNVLLTDTAPAATDGGAAAPDLLASNPLACGPAPPSGGELDSGADADSPAAAAAAAAAAAEAGVAAAGAVRGWVAKVSDFGLSKHLPDPATPHVSAAHGVITHTAPEVLMTHCQTQVGVAGVCASRVGGCGGGGGRGVMLRAQVRCVC